MKKFTILFFIEENGEKSYHERTYFAETIRELKSFPGFLSVVSSEYVTHPSPEVMQRTLLAMNIDVVSFYEECDRTAIEMERVENELCEQGDEAALKRRERKEKQMQESAKRKAEREAAKGKKNSKKKTV